MNDRQWILLAHLGALLGYTVVLGSFLVPLFVWLSKKEESELVASHAKESLNFQISMAIFVICAIPLIFVGIGILLLIALGIANIVCVILATLEADKGGFYHYPATIRFIK